jgi:hypothetical protein
VVSGIGEHALSRDKITDRLFYAGVGVGLVAVLGTGVAMVLLDASTTQTPTVLTIGSWVIYASSLALGVIACVLLLAGRARLRRMNPR